MRRRLFPMFRSQSDRPAVPPTRRGRVARLLLSCSPPLALAAAASLSPPNRRHHASVPPSSSSARRSHLTARRLQSPSPPAYTQPQHASVYDSPSIATAACLAPALLLRASHASVCHGLTSGPTYRKGRRSTPSSLAAAALSAGLKTLRQFVSSGQPLARVAARMLPQHPQPRMQ